MSAVHQNLSLEQFRSTYGNGIKPHYEYCNGEAIQKAVPPKLHAKLQRLLANVLEELGFYSFTELTLRVDASWEPIPDVAATIDDFEGPYPTAPVEVVVEVLSPQDTFGLVAQTCGLYATLGVIDILVFDRLGRKAWKWDRSSRGLIPASDISILLQSKNSAIDKGSLEEIRPELDLRSESSYRSSLRLPGFFGSILWCAVSFE